RAPDTVSLEHGLRKRSRNKNPLQPGKAPLDRIASLCQRLGMAELPAKISIDPFQDGHGHTDDWQRKTGDYATRRAFASADLRQVLQTIGGVMPRPVADSSVMQEQRLCRADMPEVGRSEES